MNKLTIILPVFAALILFFSCNNSSGNGIDKNRDPIVSVYNQTLYRDQLNSILPYNISTEDSIAAADKYIRKWIEEVLVYEKAKRNIIDSKSIDALVEDYRRSLIIHSYQETLLTNKLENGNNLSDDKLEEFYLDNKKQFILKEPIIKGLYLKIPIQSSQLENFRKWYTQESEEAINNIEKNALQNAIGYEYFYNKWVDFNGVFATIPKQASNADQYIKNNKSVEIRDSVFVYLLHIKEYKLSGDEAPFDFVKNDIVQIVREQNKNRYLKQIQNDLYEKAVSDKEIIFHNK